MKIALLDRISVAYYFTLDIDFEDHHVNIMDWMQGKVPLKNETEFGQLPVYEEDGEKYVQSIPIMRYLGRKYGYYPKDDIKKQYAIDTVMDSFPDYNFGLLKVMVAPNPKEKNLALKNFFGAHTQKFFKAWDSRIAKNNTGYMVGDGWT